jgi:hypothetical protein
MTTKHDDEPEAVREVHDIRERFYKEQQKWTHTQRRAYYDQVAAKAAKELGVRFLSHKTHRITRKAG